MEPQPQNDLLLDVSGGGATPDDLQLTVQTSTYLAIANADPPSGPEFGRGAMSTNATADTANANGSVTLVNGQNTNSQLSNVDLALNQTNLSLLEDLNARDHTRNHVSDHKPTSVSDSLAYYGPNASHNRSDTNHDTEERRREPPSASSSFTTSSILEIGAWAAE
ncbi:hypothetical protein HJFPF1_00901 [Paramyrothecium foliicola]|nr:hypothetical protein HJFPF1_00901 [Paramyrothecium foliicola]